MIDFYNNAPADLPEHTPRMLDLGRQRRGRASELMWHFLMLAMAYACVVASTAEAAPKKKGPPPDPFKACDLQVRADLREGGTWLIPRDIRLDEARLTVSVTFSPDKPIRSVPKVLYGNSDEEKRRHLRNYLEEMKAAVDGATKERAWFVVASKRTLPPHLRSPEGDASQWYGILLADIGGKCRSVAMFRNVQPDQLPVDARHDLAE
jgi:hypothetical protein